MTVPYDTRNLSDSQNDSRELRSEIKYRLVMASEITIDEPDLKRMITSLKAFITQRDLEQRKLELDRFRSIPIEKISTAVANHISQRYKSLEHQLEASKGEAL